MALKLYIIRLLMFLLSIGLLTACTTLPDHYSTTNTVSNSELLDGVAFLGEKLDESELPNSNIMNISPEMEIFLAENIAGINSRTKKATTLSKIIFDQDGLGLTYDPRLTFTAEQTFKNRIGNCLAFSYLYTVMARKVGLEVEFQEVHILPEWDYTDNEIYVENRHINVRVDVSRFYDLVVDINQVTREQQIDHTILKEEQVLALYYGNIGAEFLMKENYEEAYKYFVKAIKTDEETAMFWTNLGVLYRRVGNAEFAEKAYFVALSYDNGDQAALNNLSYLYREAGDDERADYYGGMVKKYQQSNPYYKYVEAIEALEMDLYDLALNHINYAIRKKNTEPRFYTLKSEIYEKLGKPKKAILAMKNARRYEENPL